MTANGAMRSSGDLSPGVGFFLSVVLGLCACGDRSGASNAAGDPCALVTATEAAGLMGGTVDAPQRVTAGTARACVYRRAGGEVRIVTETLADAASFKPDKSGLGAGAEAVAGIGDEAYVLSRALDVVLFRKGNVQVLISVAEPPGLADTTRDALVTIGKLAAPRM